MVDFKIALYGQIDSDTKFGYTYPDAFNPMSVTTKDEWLRSISEPRDARVFKDAHVYAIWKNELGNFYASIFPNTQDSRNGYLILTLFTGKMAPTSGSTMVKVLSDLRKLIVEQGVRDHQQIADYLAGVDGLFTRDNVPAPTATKSIQKAFRPYGSEAELCDLLQNIDQEAYTPYKRVLLVPRASVPTQLTTDYVELKNTITHTYTINLPSDGTRTSKTIVKDGDTFDITYSKSGYEPESQTVLVGRASQLFTIDGNIIRIKSAADAGIKFMRGIVLNVCSPKGVSIPEFTINNKKVSNGTKIKLPDEPEYMFTISAPGYEVFKMKKRASELTSPMRITLQPKDLEMPVTMKYYDQTIRGNVMVSADDPLYRFFKDNYTYQFVIKGGAHKSKGGNSFKKYLWPIIGLLLLVAGFFVWQCSGGEDDFESSNNDSTNTVLAGKPKTSGEAPDSNKPKAKDTLAVRKYLKKASKQGDKEVWELDSLQGIDAFTKVFEYIQTDNVDALIEWDYKNDTEYLNGYWKSIVENLQTMKSCKIELKGFAPYVKDSILKLQEFKEYVERLKNMNDPTPDDATGTAPKTEERSGASDIRNSSSGTTTSGRKTSGII